MKNSVVGTTAAKKIAGEGKKEDKKKGSDIVKEGVKGLLNILKQKRSKKHKKET